jgi:antitoxin YefM
VSKLGRIAIATGCSPLLWCGSRFRSAPGELDSWVQSRSKAGRVPWLALSGVPEAALWDTAAGRRPKRPFRAHLGRVPRRCRIADGPSRTRSTISWPSVFDDHAIVYFALPLPLGRVGGKVALKPPSELPEAVTGGSTGIVARHWTQTGACATIVAMTAAEPLRAVRDHLSEVVDRVQRHHERVIITRNGHDAAVVISPEDLAQLEETIAVLSDPEALADIREADAAYDRGDVVRGVDAVRQLRRD